MIRTFGLAAAVILASWPVGSAPAFAREVLAAGSALEDGGPGAAEADLPWAGTRGVTIPQIRSRTYSDFPEVARKAKIGAGLLVQVIVRRDGSVEIVKLLGCRVWKWGKAPDARHAGHCPALFEEVSSAIEQWKYDPPLVEGRPVDAYHTIEARISREAAEGPTPVWSETERLALLPPEARPDAGDSGSARARASRPAAALPPDDPWIEVRTKHFTVYSNAGAGPATRVGVRLETLREVLRRLHGGASVGSPRPSFVYLFRDHLAFAPYTVGESVGGYFLEALDGNFLAIHSTEGYGGIVYHEYLHYFLSNNLPYIPVWLSEGMAELYSTFGIVQDVVQIGGAPREHLEELRRREPMSLNELFAVTHDSEAYNETERRSLFYAQSWALVHYLILGDPELTPRLVDFVARLGRGETPDAAFRDAFHMTHEDLLQRLRVYLREGRYPKTTIRAEELDVDTSAGTRPLSRAEALARLGLLLVHADRTHPDGAAEHFRAALAADPGLALAHVGRGMVLDLRGDQAGALDALAEAMSLDPQDDLAPLLRADILLGQSRGASGQTGAPDPALLAESKSLLLRAVELNPQRGDSHRLLGVALAEDRSCEEGPRVLETAWRMMPSDLTIAGNLARLLGICGEVDNARYIVETFLVPYAEPDEARDVERFIRGGEMNEVRRLAIEARHDEARAKLEELLGRDQDPAIRAEIETSLADVRNHLDYAEAVAAFNRGDHATALDLAGRLRASLDTTGGDAPAETQELSQELAYLVEVARIRQSVEQARRLASAGDCRAATALLDEAERSVTGLLREATTDRQRTTFSRELTGLRLDRDACWKTLYQSAVRLAVQGEREAAAAIVREVLAGCTDPETLASAHKALAQLTR